LLNLARQGSEHFIWFTKCTHTERILLRMKSILSIFFVAGISAHSYCQEQTITLENGVIVHQAVGMEGTVQNQTTSSAQTRTVNDWNLSECLETLEIINQKCEQISSEECNAYAPLIQSIQHRIAVLNQATE